jgi:hypothetical protein
MIKKLILGLAVVGVLALPASSVQATPVAQPQQLMAATCPGRFLTAPAWYRGLKDDTTCNPKLTKLTDIWIIGLNIVEMMLHAVTYVAAGFLIWGGFRYMSGNAGGNSEKSTGAKGTITHAITGLAISVIAIAAINFIVDAAL